jgi:hypothetical protein
MASDFEDADSVVEEFTGLHTTREKLDYLLNNFDVRIIGGTEEGTIEEEYLVVLTAIVDHKWR